MAIHLFSQPVECTNCGTVVDDPTLDRCPSCQALLRERRTPSRLAGVERRYGGTRVLLAIFRFLGVATALLGLLLTIFSTGEEITWYARLLTLAGTLVVTVALFATAALFEVVFDIEENTRASFRLQQRMLEPREPGRTPAH